MSQEKSGALRLFNPCFWGISVGLSWMWGLGLFFSVQFAFHYGMVGLLSFAIPNAIGLFLFGVGTHRISRGLKGSTLEAYFDKWAKPYGSVLLLYQLLAIAITTFAVTSYLFFALDWANPWLMASLCLASLIALVFFLGEEFDIRRIKFSHSIFFIPLVLCIALIIIGAPLLDFADAGADAANADRGSYNSYWGFLIPMCVGLFFGPWLDLQHWQRAIQMEKEGTSIRSGYLVGALVFFGLLLFHGSLAIWAVGQGAAQFAQTGVDGHTYAHELITRLLTTADSPLGVAMLIAYAAFIGICVLTTLDSGYIAIRWYIKRSIKGSNHLLLALVPNNMVTSPVPYFVVAGGASLLGVLVGLELEYFMVFYATFFVGYAASGVLRSIRGEHDAPIPQQKVFAISLLSLGVFSMGYIQQQSLLMIVGSLLPPVGVWWLMLRSKVLKAPSSTASEAGPVVEEVPIEEDSNDQTPVPASRQVATGGLSEYVDGSWFVHVFKATYSDTNSVGNVYFGMYPMWVGKTRELFFNHCMPAFDLKNTHYLILTRSFEHKFIRESREFDQISVKIRVKSFNRKFVTLEHIILDGSKELLGKGTQTLLFVSAASYKLLDIPEEVHIGFLPFRS